MAERHRLVLNEHMHEKVHGAGLVGRFNAWLAVLITRSVGSMFCAYAFVALALVSLPAAIKSGDLVIMVSWISQTFLQLVLLSVILVGQRVSSDAQDARASTDHDTLTVLHQLTEQNEKLLELQSQVLEQQNKVLDGIVICIRGFAPY